MQDEPMVSRVLVLETVRLRLRGHRLEDFEASARMWADERVVRYISGKPSSRSDSWSRLLRYIGHWQALSFGYWVVEDRISGDFLGEVGFANYKRDISPPLDEVPEIGWVLIADAHGRGIATEAVAAALGWADRHFAHAETVCLFDPQHQASIRVAEKSGYSRKGEATYMGRPTLVMQRMRPLLVAAPDFG
ncbi:GNAT family N-acetyltransferase [Agrobacterium vitis]|uniref:GNAT family N-acetyltransferase n=1 Tax=Agrobacterium vitis TaxID=373 RepID=A0AAE4WFC6_AGRVI|nr:GNAT family N-acetyltransferase [Agrobacterium vitis]MCF1500657.1 GNAT family N-acetyltransferase [Allorhizobium sp. Av2]MCM2441970.1 GNAT family N-acetyltransferase [Agrobacterium vitis]MUZ59746.1 GNAT family N-acetyltransferase [Agrobacterium vitis]MVA67047.1 GNAT family N-acetyltransferase [Agrobacterium vitis]MVA89109.1 GNAT family N-acetyltransferase [Agrobacterium vitis]